jgi:hypothetical protein
MNTLDLEYKYRVEVAGSTTLLPFTLAKKKTAYPVLCIFHPEEPAAAVRKTHLCEACTEALKRSLEDIALRWTDLEEALGANGGASSRERVSGTGDLYPPLPINTNISDVMRVARSLVWSTVGQLVQDRPDQTLPRDHGTGVLADWLARWHVGYLASHPSVGHLVSVCTELADAADKVRKTIYQANTYEMELKNASCHQHITDAEGRRVPCPGQVVGILLPSGRKMVECDEDPMHFVSADQWFQTQARRDSYRKRDIAKLHRKYARKVRA